MSAKHFEEIYGQNSITVRAYPEGHLCTLKTPSASLSHRLSAGMGVNDPVVQSPPCNGTNSHSLLATR